jgi:alkylation response protein AidB-like acyl-CoA dehydrogenase
MPVSFALNSDQVLLKEAVKRFLDERYGSTRPDTYAAHARGYSLENWRAMAAMGLLALPFSLEDGGLNGGSRELITVMEQLGRRMAVEPVLEEIVMAGGLLSRGGSRAQKAEWLPRIISGEAHLALAHFEHAARFNLQWVQVRAQSHAGTVLLQGEKSVVPLAAAADAWIVSARDEGGCTDPRGIGFYLVSPGASGIERRDFRLMDGTIASCIRFKGVATEGRLPGGYDAFSAAVDATRLAAGAEMIGIMSTLFESTLDYLRCRKQFGVSLSSFQALQHRLADLYILLEQSRSQLYRAALAVESPRNFGRSIAGMKSYISAAAVEMGEECVHLHGGIGTTKDLSLGFGYKQLMVLANLFGSADAELTRFIGAAS